MKKTVHIGTSGWHYRHWKGPFYPQDLAAGEMLGFYAERLRTVELNNSFYRLPKINTLRSWAAAVPEDFLFAVKASRYITHMKKLKDATEPTGKFLDRVEVLGERLGPVLFQLPPNWHSDHDRLKEFLAALPKGRRYAFEFRDPSWHNAGIYRLLEEAGAAFCIYELAGHQSPHEVTADFVYVRLHGPGAAYQGNYSPRALSGWAGAFSAWRDQGKEIFCFFDNDQHGYAVLNAMSLAKMLG